MRAPASRFDFAARLMPQAPQQPETTMIGGAHEKSVVYLVEKATRG